MSKYEDTHGIKITNWTFKLLKDECLNMNYKNKRASHFKNQSSLAINFIVEKSSL